MIILLIVTLCLILYKSGLVGQLLQRLETSDPAPATKEVPETREKWEKEARYILAKQGLVEPDTVRYMGDEMLIHIVREYLDI